MVGVKGKEHRISMFAQSFRDELFKFRALFPQLNLQIQPEYVFPSLTTEHSNRMRVDFFVTCSVIPFTWVIEDDDTSHLDCKITVWRDVRKNVYCYEHGIHLLRVLRRTKVPLIEVFSHMVWLILKS